MRAQVVGVFAVTDDFDPRANPDYKPPRIEAGINKMKESARGRPRASIKSVAESSVRSSRASSMSYGPDVDSVDLVKIDELRQAFALSHESPEQVPPRSPYHPLLTHPTTPVAPPLPQRLTPRWCVRADALASDHRVRCAQSRSRDER